MEGWRGEGRGVVVVADVAGGGRGAFEMGFGKAIAALCVLEWPARGGPDIC